MAAVSLGQREHAREHHALGVGRPSGFGLLDRVGSEPAHGHDDDLVLGWRSQGRHEVGEQVRIADGHEDAAGARRQIRAVDLAGRQEVGGIGVRRNVLRRPRPQGQQCRGR